MGHLKFYAVRPQAKLAPSGGCWEVCLGTELAVRAVECGPHPGPPKKSAEIAGQMGRSPRKEAAPKRIHQGISE